jgi:hypothetical protein
MRHTNLEIEVALPLQCEGEMLLLYQQMQGNRTSLVRMPSQDENPEVGPFRSEIQVLQQYVERTKGLGVLFMIEFRDHHLCCHVPNSLWASCPYIRPAGAAERTPVVTYACSLPMEYS